MLKIAYHSIYTHPLPEKHRFPMIKYELLAKQLLYEEACKEESFFQPNILDATPILAVHTKDYYKNLIY